MIAGGVEREAGQPGGEGGLAPETGERVPGFNERLLGDLGGILGVGDHGIRDAIDPLVVLLQQAAKRRLVASTATSQQVRLTLRVV